MHGSSIQVVGVEVVDALGANVAFTARRCLLCVGGWQSHPRVPFHDLSDTSSQVLQQSHEVIDLICLHQSNALALIELAHAIQEHFHQLSLLKSLIRVNAHDVLSPFPCQGHEATLTMIALHRHLQEERIGHLWCCDVVHGIDTEGLQCGVAEVLECIRHESHIEYVVQFVVFTLLLDIQCHPEHDYVLILVLKYNLAFYIINALFTKRNDGDV